MHWLIEVDWSWQASGRVRAMVRLILIPIVGTLPLRAPQRQSGADFATAPSWEQQELEGVDEFPTRKLTHGAMVVSVLLQFKFDWAVALSQKRAAKTRTRAIWSLLEAIKMMRIACKIGFVGRGIGRFWVLELENGREEKGLYKEVLLRSDQGIVIYFILLLKRL